MPGSVSVRQHIRWGTDPPSEPTDTLVLTSPGRYFVDIRVLKAALPQHTPPPSSTPLLAQPGPRSARPDGTPFSHAVFTHWVDSRTTAPEAATDEGDMFPQPDGTTLETGRMRNPATGELAPYEELWRDAQPQHLPPLPECTVLRLHDEAHATRGLFVQLGPHAQGLVRLGHVVTAERWVWSSAALGWERVFAIGHQTAPSLDDIMPALRSHPRKGDKLAARTGTWAVVEVGA